uniref:Uncharacterized protein n=1 Tax=Oryza rufipogon TaxID=4529 RepID=A0A0E0MXD9_ORYRU
MHLIILVIWKLSDHKHFQAQQQQLKDPCPHLHPAVPMAAVLPAAAEDAPSLVVKPKEEFNISPDSGGGESCVTTESDEDASTAASYTSDARQSLAPPPQKHSVLEQKFSLPLPGVAETALDSGRDDDDLDAMWNAIMQKTRPATASYTAPLCLPRARSPPLPLRSANAAAQPAACSSTAVASPFHSAGHRALDRQLRLPAPLRRRRCHLALLYRPPSSPSLPRPTPHVRL